MYISVLFRAFEPQQASPHIFSSMNLVDGQLSLAANPPAAPELLQLMTAYPIDILWLSAEPAPELEDVSMAEPEQSGNNKEETGTPRDCGSHDAVHVVPVAVPARVGVAHKKTTAQTSAEPMISTPETRHAALKVRVENMLADPGMVYKMILTGQLGGSKVDGQLIKWDSCCAPKAVSISMSQLCSQGSLQLLVEELEAQKSCDNTEESKSSAESVREIIKDPVNTSQATMVEELTPTRRNCLRPSHNAGFLGSVQTYIFAAVWPHNVQTAVMRTAKKPKVITAKKPWAEDLLRTLRMAEQGLQNHETQAAELQTVKKPIIQRPAQGNSSSAEGLSETDESDQDIGPGASSSDKAGFSGQNMVQRTVNRQSHWETHQRCIVINATTKTSTKKCGVKDTEVITPTNSPSTENSSTLVIWIFNLAKNHLLHAQKCLGCCKCTKCVPHPSEHPATTNSSAANNASATAGYYSTLFHAETGGEIGTGCL
ncbi:hypothetical protein FIBSPDRAFT_887195 [Athelia psychrophila]|uniref:Uncharacterized protein n=1 Tax=Athelia psychrophila TaxID=1759441 RepID=A0A166Q3A0_9AGAM|nr:hypothetical protein FIBSPDRAFT_887195 [Fibularhizoctonia sp. CBS 109695]